MDASLADGAERRDTETRRADLNVVWTRTSPRLLRVAGAGQRFVQAAMPALDQLVSAVRMRDSVRIHVRARELAAVADAIGARGLSTLAIAVRADGSAGDWTVADARVDSIAGYIQAITDRLARDARALSVGRLRHLSERSVSLPIQRAVGSPEATKRSAHARAAV